MRQQHNAKKKNVADTGQELQFLLNIRMKEKCDLSDCDHGRDHRARGAGLSISEAAALLRFFTHTTRVYTEWCTTKKNNINKKKNYGSVNGTALLIREITRKWFD